MRQELVRAMVLAAGAALLASGCIATATSFYPVAGFQEGSLPPREPNQVTVHLDGSIPTCRFRELGTILYDWARDGIFTSESVALSGAQAMAARLGATGIYKLQFTGGAAVGVGSSLGTGIAQGSGNVVTATATG